MCGNVLDSAIVCGNQKSAVCENVLDSFYNISVTEGGNSKVVVLVMQLFQSAGVMTCSTVCHMSECASSLMRRIHLIAQGVLRYSSFPT